MIIKFLSLPYLTITISFYFPSCTSFSGSSPISIFCLWNKKMHNDVPRPPSNSIFMNSTHRYRVHVRYYWWRWFFQSKVSTASGSHCLRYTLRHSSRPPPPAHCADHSREYNARFSLSFIFSFRCETTKNFVPSHRLLICYFIIVQCTPTTKGHK